MKKFTCTLALLLALLFGLSCLQPSALAAEGVAPAWNGIPATSFSGGSGTESDPYLISNGGELAYLAQKVNESNSTSNPYRGAWYRPVSYTHLNLWGCQLRKLEKPLSF